MNCNIDELSLVSVSFIAGVFAKCWSRKYDFSHPDKNFNQGQVLILL